MDTDVTVSASGVNAANGVLAGYVTQDDFYGSINTVVSTLCGCLGLPGDLFTQNGAGAWEGDCVAGAANVCTAPDEEVCATLAGNNLLNGQICGVVPTLIGVNADIDTDGDTTTWEALSAGLRFEGAQGEILGLLP